MDYAQRAGVKVLQLHLHQAAIDYFSWAIDAAHHLSISPSAVLYRTRGQAYEIHREFEQAHLHKQWHSVLLPLAQTITGTDENKGSAIRFRDTTGTDNLLAETPKRRHRERNLTSDG